MEVFMLRQWQRSSFAVFRLAALIGTLASPVAIAADWRQFRGPNGQGAGDEAPLPVHWSASENIAWRTELPGAGTSSPVTLGDRIYVTCYSGYGMDADAPGEMANLKRHVVCLDRATGGILWQRQFDPVLPEHQYQGEGTYHGYSSSTPATDGERLYIFFGKSGVHCLDLEGRTLWQANVGDGIHGWGSGASPVLYKNLLLVNASVECGSLVALDKLTGEEVWRAGGVGAAWNTPVLVDLPDDQRELVVSVESRLLAFQPDTGEALWNADGVHRYVCPSVVAGEGVVYAIGGGHTSLAVRAGGRGDVTGTHTVWRENRGSNVSSPVYHDGHVYWASDSGGVVTCQEATTGRTVYQERLEPASGLIYASPILAGGKLYYVSQRNGTYVVAARPEYELLAHNVFADDDSRMNASPVASDGQLLLRNDKHLYCIGEKR
jgi:outer membrane protein assembly factor BamB